MLSGYSYSVGEDGEPALHAPGETVPADAVDIAGGKAPYGPYGGVYVGAGGFLSQMFPPLFFCTTGRKLTVFFA